MATSPDVFERLLWGEWQTTPVEVRKKGSEDATATFKPTLNKNTEELVAKRRLKEGALSPRYHTPSKGAETSRSGILLPFQMKS